MTAGPASIAFETTLTAFGNNTGIVVPADLLAGLGAGQRPPVSVDLNSIAGAKTADTRQRRIDKAVELFLAGRAR